MQKNIFTEIKIMLYDVPDLNLLDKTGPDSRVSFPDSKQFFGPQRRQHVLIWVRCKKADGTWYIIVVVLSSCWWLEQEGFDNIWSVEKAQNLVTSHWGWRWQQLFNQNPSIHPLLAYGATATSFSYEEVSDWGPGWVREEAEIKSGILRL